MHDLRSLSLLVQSLSAIGRGDWLPFVELVLCGKIHDGQAEFLAGSRFRENLLHPGNGWGKTEVIAIKHLFFILSHFGDSHYRTLNIAITLDQSELVFDRILKYCNESAFLRSLSLVASTSRFPFPRITFANGAVTEFRTTKKKAESVEGHEYGYISADEIALELHLEFIRDKILLPRLRKYVDSQLDFFATPKGLNAYYRIAEDIKRKGGFVRGGTSYENPWIDHTLLEYQRTTWSEAKINQIIMGKFIDTAEMMFASRVPVLFDDSLSLVDGCERGRKYIEGWDLARGRRGERSDQTVGFRLDATNRTARIVRRWAFQLPWTEKEREIMTATGALPPTSSIEREIRTAHYDSTATVLVDSTGVGDTLWAMVQDIARPVDFRGGNKDRILDHLQAVIDAGLLRSPFIPELADEMTVYQREDKTLETDNIMALAIACSAITFSVGTFGTVEG